MEADHEDQIAADAPGLYDATWGDEQWAIMLRRLVDKEIVTWREVATTILGELNPGQVGTGIASSDATRFGFKRNHAKTHPGESFMPYVLSWFYALNGRCIDCGTRLDLQSDHVEGRESFSDPRDADWLNNMTLRCRRHNVAKRKSHVARAGRTLLPAQQALMWILFQIRPVTQRDFARLCRLYGMTMAGIRFEEAWAMAIWLERIGQYRIANDSDRYDLILWPNNAVTRRFVSDEPTPETTDLLRASVIGEAIFCFLSSSDATPKTMRYFEFPMREVPFAYDLGERAATDIAMWPNQHGGTPLAPRDGYLHAFMVRAAQESVQLAWQGEPFAPAPPTPRIYFRGARVHVPAAEELSLIVA